MTGKATNLAQLSLRNIIQSEWKWWLTGAVLAFVLASVLMSGWPTGLLPNLDYPYTYSGDGLSSSWAIQRSIEGWIIDNPRSGFPFGSNFLDYPGADAGNQILFKIIGMFTGVYYSTLNLYFLFGFSATFATTYCVARVFGLELSFSLSIAVLFSFASFHFRRIEHLYYTWYFVVPIFYLISLKFFNADFLFVSTKNITIKKLIFALSLIVLGSFGVYYTLFGLLVILVGVISMTVEKYNIEQLKIAFIICSMVVLGVLLNISPNLIHRYTTGANPEAVQRSYADVEVLGFKFVQLVIPRLGHRNDTLNNISEKYSATSPLVNENTTASLGIVGACGLFAIFGVAYCVLSGREYGRILKFVALIVLTLFMFGTIGGFGSIFSYAISSSIRGWNRISIFIEFGALLVFFMFLQAVCKNNFTGKKLIYTSISIAIIITSIGLYDQTTSSCIACNEETKRTFFLDRKFIQEIENLLPTNSAIYQLPYMAFPEAPPLHRLKNYEQVSGFLHSTTLRWNYAGMKGRGGDLFYRSLSKEPLQRQLEVIKRLGFAGIYVDRRGFENNGETVIEGLTSLLGAPPTLTRADGEVAFFRINQEGSNVNLEGLSDEQIMMRAGYIVDRLGPRYDATFSEGINFARSDFPIFIKDIKGLSAAESWGRWTDANLAPALNIDLTRPLPNRFKFVLLARPFGPNANQNLEVRIGSQVHHYKMLTGDFEYRQAIDLRGEKVTHIELVSPQPTSPQQLNMGADPRKIGIGLITLRFENEQ